MAAQPNHYQKVTPPVPVDQSAMLAVVAIPFMLLAGLYLPPAFDRVRVVASTARRLYAQGRQPLPEPPRAMALADMPETWQ